MIRSFRDAGTEDIFNGADTKRTRKACPRVVWKVARRKLELLDSARTLEDLRVPPANQLEALKKDRAGQHSIRVNNQYRVCFVWTELGPAEVELGITTRDRALELPMVRIPTHQAPTHPGELLLEEFLNPMGLSQQDLADGIRVPYQRVNELVNGRRGITPSTALRLAKFFGTTPDLWMNLQLRWDLYHTQEAEQKDLQRIRRVRVG